MTFEREHTFPGQVHLIPEKEELQRPRKENQRLRIEHDIIKKATAFFVKESVRRQQKGLPHNRLLSSYES